MEGLRVKGEVLRVNRRSGGLVSRRPYCNI